MQEKICLSMLAWETVEASKYLFFKRVGDIIPYLVLPVTNISYRTVMHDVSRRGVIGSKLETSQILINFKVYLLDFK